MCSCSHGRDRHYLDYAGPGVCGAILSCCLEKDCPCALFTPVIGVIHPAAIIVPVGQVGWAGQTNAGSQG